MERGKIVAIITGVISILIAVAYLVFVQVLDFRGEMIPAPTGELSTPFTVSLSPSTDMVVGVMPLWLPPV